MVREFALSNLNAHTRVIISRTYLSSHSTYLLLIINRTYCEKNCIDVTFHFVFVPFCHDINGC